MEDCFRRVSVSADPNTMAELDDVISTLSQMTKLSAGQQPSVWYREYQLFPTGDSESTDVCDQWEDFARNGVDSDVGSASSGGYWSAGTSLGECSPMPSEPASPAFPWNHFGTVEFKYRTASVDKPQQPQPMHMTTTCRTENLAVKHNEPVVAMNCVLCRNNGESRSVFQTHNLKDERGMVTCPVLFGYVCPYCQATGQLAHTIRYCPMAPPGVSVIKSLKTARDSAGNRRCKK